MTSGFAGRVRLPADRYVPAHPLGTAEHVGA
jgi:hypothetical protein